MSKNILDKKIPSLFGLGILTIGLIATTYLVKGPGTFQIQADLASEPENIQITNISDSSFTVIYSTDDPVIGTVTYGETSEKLDKLNLDDRDQLSQKTNAYKAHSITVNNLSPNTNYYFTITSDDKTIKNNNDSFNVKTGPNINNSPSAQDPMNGKVINPEGKIMDDGLVIVNINGAQKISGILKENGNFTIPLNNLRENDLTNYFVINNNSDISVDIISDNLSSNIKLSKDQLSPIPIITLSNNYDFLSSDKKAMNTKINEGKFPEFNSKIRKPSISPTPEKSQSL